MPDKRQQFLVAITCPGCGASGAVVWEESGSQDRTRGSERRLLSIEGEFHVETGRTNSGDPLVVCNACDQIQDD